MVCEIVPGTIGHDQPGWYLIAADRFIEAGPFATREDAGRAAWWLWDQNTGTHPAPWAPHHSHTPLIVGERLTGKTRGTRPQRRDSRRPATLADVGCAV